MKKVLPIALLIITTSVFSQAIKPGENVVGLKTVFGDVSGANSGFTADYERGFKDGLDYGGMPGTFGLGASFGFSKHTDIFTPEPTFEYRWTFTNILLTGFGAYHADILKNPKIDTYVKLNLGWNVAVVKSSRSENYPDAPGAKSNGGFLAGISLGAKYLFSDRLAGVAEGGYGMGFFRIGIDYKL